MDSFRRSQTLSVLSIFVLTSMSGLCAGCTIKIRSLTEIALLTNTSAPVALKLSGGMTNALQGMCTGAIQVTRVDAQGDATSPNQLTSVSLNGAVNGTFHGSTNCSGSAITSIDIPSGQSSVSISFVNPVSGTENLSVAATGLTGDNLSISTTALLAAGQNYTNGSAGESWVGGGDLDKDGNLDLIAVNDTDSEMNVFLGNGDGTFQAAAPFATLAGPRMVAVADVDKDSWLDVIVTHWTDASFSVYFNDTAGGFARVDYAASANLITFVTGDFDGDTHLDIAFAQSSTDLVRIYWGNSANDATNFASGDTYGVGDAPLRIAQGDFDGDGDTDLVTGNRLGNSVSMLENDGLGVFTVSTVLNLGAGVEPSDLAVGDLNGDGNLDLVISRRALGEVGIHLGNGDLSFEAADVYATGSTPNALQLQDLNGDGALDLLNVTTSASPSLHLWFGVGDGTLRTPRSSFATSGLAMQAFSGDFDGNGSIDIAVSPSSGTTSVTVYLNNN